MKRLIPVDRLILRKWHMKKNLVCANVPKPALTLTHFLFCTCDENGAVNEGLIQDVTTCSFWAVQIV